MLASFVFFLVLLLTTSGEVECRSRKKTHDEGPSSSNKKSPSSSLFESKVGVNYGRIADNLPPPNQVLQLLTSATDIRKVKLFDAEPSVLSAFSNTDFSLVVSAPNYMLSDLASDQSKALNWLTSSVASFYPATNITHIAVGNEVFSQTDGALKANLLPAMKNVYSALEKLKLHKRIKVSTPHAMSVLSSSFPPSNGSFSDTTRASLMPPLLQFLNDTGNPFMINVYPFFAYSTSPKSVSLDFVLFRSTKGELDPMSGLSYANMFDAQLDAVHFAMQSLGFDRIPLLVSETGWPSSGDDSETGASVENAREYIRNLVKHVTSTSGTTPVRPSSPTEVYIFALFNEDQKPGPKSERNFGLFQPNGSPVYSSDVLHSGSNGSGTSGAASKSKGRKKRSINPPRHHHHHQKMYRSSASSVRQWCIAKPGADAAALEKGITFACAEGGIDCSPIQSNGSCFDPQIAFSHASFVYNSYFQKMGRNSWNCYFQDTAMITITDPSYGSCRYLST
ncbi:glucan endo-1,3-beta-D-glucosidase [Selaginella moellendorffii]|uniref:glucan endo-1,3-beta-D-glucosidase n=1 Tax=Selaginella moellendorffii TaxID=88036 RepID=UPI000D1CA765|nr:glucan endo-1,3-beta-D-glucosidase [Selaginella moellendorffii]|eukprot:XP_002967295.2 glucan endo-1,3-beta-D-glucosidase [Selaginella moellendorffii]